MTVYRLKALRGEGWIADVDSRGPRVTAVKAAARTWDDIDAARKALALANQPGKVPNMIVADPE